MVGMVLVLAVLGAGGCGSGSSRSSASVSRSISRSGTVGSPAAGTPATVCATGRIVLARRFGVRASAVVVRPMRTSDGMPRCDFTVGSLAAWVSVDSSPQPYQVLERRANEEGQNFGMFTHFPYPQAVTHLGLDAWWFPREQQGQTTDGTRLLTFTVTRWPGHGNGPRKALMRVVLKPYLGKLIGARTAKGEV